MRADRASQCKSRDIRLVCGSPGSDFSSIIPFLCKLRKMAYLTKSHGLTWTMENKNNAILHRAFEGGWWDKATDTRCFPRNRQFRKFKHNKRQRQNQSIDLGVWGHALRQLGLGQSLGTDSKARSQHCAGKFGVLVKQLINTNSVCLPGDKIVKEVMATDICTRRQGSGEARKEGVCDISAARKWSI